MSHINIDNTIKVLEAEIEVFQQFKMHQRKENKIVPKGFSDLEAHIRGTISYLKDRKITIQRLTKDKK